MCNYFSCIFRPGGVINFTETDSHEDTIHRLNLHDESEFNRNFLRMECDGGDISKFTIDEDTDNLPTWYADHEQAYHDKLAKLLVSVNEIKAERNAIDAKWQTEYDAVDAKWRTGYDAIDAKWQTECDAVRSKWQTEYDAVDAKWRTECDAVNAKWQPELDAVDARFAKIEGFVKA